MQLMKIAYKPSLFLFLIAFAGSTLSAQESYRDSLYNFQQNYVSNHGVVKGNDRKQLQFYPVTTDYRVEARVERIYEAPWFKMETSSKEKQPYRVYAVLHFFTARYRVEIARLPITKVDGHERIC